MRHSHCHWFVLVLSLYLLHLAFLAAPLSAQTNRVPKAPIVPEQLLPEIRTLQSGVKMTLIAEHPELATPTGIDVDSQGRIWLIACHTHFRPEGYKGPEHDEILIFDPNNQGARRRVFYNKTDATMHLQIGNDGWVYLAERDRILRIKDSDGDGVGDVEENLAVLDTLADYPHNGLSGMAWDTNGGLVFSLGENFGKDWTLAARDGTKESGRGEGGVFWMQADGTKMRRIARGFWNPFGLAVRSDGEIFAAENDPGSRPPCRLLQIIEGADYGYQWVYGSAPVHPFVAWNGELRGTLGMIHPCGEGPSAIVELGGGMLIPSWSNHAIDYFPLIRSQSGKGAGYTSRRVEVISGSEYFRPVAIAAAPNGDLYLTDWVYSSYELHGRGRLWKLEIDRKSAWVKPEREPENDATRLARQLRESGEKKSLAELMSVVRGDDVYLRDAALSAIAKHCASWTTEQVKQLSTDDRLWVLVALRRIDLKEEKWVRALWDDQDPAIRFEVLRWIADGVLIDFTDRVAQMLTQSNLDFTLFEAALATLNTLKGNPGAGVTDAEVLIERLQDPATPPRIKSFALRLVPVAHKKLDLKLLKTLLAEGNRDLTVEVVRTLGAMRSADAVVLLSDIAKNSQNDEELRADATAGIGQSLSPQSSRELVNLCLELAESSQRSIRVEALRALRAASLTDEDRKRLNVVVEKFPDSRAAVETVLDPAKQKTGRPAPTDVAAWMERLNALPGKADPNAGRRVFHHASIGQCANCHRHSGRGNVVGPDLSLVKLQTDRAGLLRSILEPNRDVAPQYFATVLELADGNVFTGILLRSSSVDVYRDSNGKERVFQKSDVVMRKELTTSVMPTGLVEQLSDEDLRDLLMFLGQ